MLQMALEIRQATPILFTITRKKKNQLNQSTNQPIDQSTNPNLKDTRKILGLFALNATSSRSKTTSKETKEIANYTFCIAIMHSSQQTQMNGLTTQRGDIPNGE
ncbi:hypothetical protein PHYBLDRAFT_66305 [Phycomyces blakesleeanus NRRL 1555(-)]|uniref:Uncharacterized protein n=1 Tax=Phycomyces blakesleeanus (strain ATCC 8743b / DSM 1359 / FGSC 10004 / NBRC 33097 / NRRL 1555) TaxID=763407 RepID=A0A162TSM7_PHYB8|nr:hypothetical protein PHYBLDRAFT_66305 [Phycomyces blakesleeanus NRRL 1555(-)]OAD69473.1 hypothetical protein PHYBLDRAFT_66305 [Phycomyces blakesleeanus NRRL 1555(-)]|eukprot:XP_018287513.1 hypothetical protein PHYBLDRAFT_66305 [Phycomyces blakesleeanus NRRL 1555(-)]